MIRLNRYITRYLSLFTILIGCLVITGWLFDISFFKSPVPGIISMKFNTAVCFILSGFTLYLLDTPIINPPGKTATFICAWIILIVGSLNLAEYIFNKDLGIDELLWKEGPGTAATVYPGRMSLITAANFIVLGFTFLNLDKKKYYWIIQVLLFLMIPCCLLAIFNYIFGNSFLTIFPLLKAMALHSAILFIVLNIGIFFSSPFRYIQFSFRKKITSFFALVLFVLGMLLFAFEQNKRQALATAKQVEHTLEVLLVAEQVNTHANTLQSNARGYIITGEENYSQQFDSVNDSLNETISRLKMLTANDAAQQIRVDTLKKLIDVYIASRKELIDTRRNKGFEAAHKIFLTGNGQSRFENGRVIIGAIKNEESRLLAERKVANGQTLQNSSNIAVFFQVIIVVLLLAALLLVYKNTRARDKAERQSSENEKQIQTIFNAAPDAVIVIDDRGNIVKWNTKAETLFGWMADEVLGKRLADIIIPQRFREAHQQGLKRYLETGEGPVIGKTIEIQAINNKNVEFDIELSISPTIVEDKHLFIGFIRDVTEKKSVREKLKESEEQYSTLFNSIDQGFCIIEMLFDQQLKPVDYRFLVINASFERQTGLHNVVGKRMREFAPNHEEHWFEIYGKIALTGESMRFENRAEQLGRWYEVYAFRFAEPKNRQVAILFNDITDRKQAEETIRQLNLDLEKQVEKKTEEVVYKEQQYRFLIENMREGVQVIGHDWRYVFVNKAVVKQSKYSKEELLEHTIMENYPGVEGTELFRSLERCMKERIPELMESEFIFPDGSKEWFELSIQPVPEGIFILSMDISERRKLEEQQVLLASIVNSSDDAILSKDLDGTIMSWNHGAEKIFGYSPDEIIGKHISILMAPHFQNEEYEIMKNIRRGQGIDHYETERIRKDGKMINVSLTISPIKDSFGKIIGASKISRDITEKKKDEERLKRYAEELKNSNAELERFAYVASHDLQEPLRMVSSFLNLLEDEFEEKLDETAKQYIHFAVDGAARMKTLVSDLLSYSQIGTNKEQLTTIDLNDTMEYVLRVLDQDIKKNRAQLTMMPLPVIRANKTLITQLFTNLLSNALKYHSDKPSEIEIGYIEEKDKYIFYIKDNGIGIDPKFFDKIFIIFQRLHTKSEYTGTGIGLAICKKIVEVHNGKIWVESDKGKGSTFFFSILKHTI